MKLTIKTRILTATLLAAPFAAAAPLHYGIVMSDYANGTGAYYASASNLNTNYNTGGFFNGLGANQTVNPTTISLGANLGTLQVTDSSGNAAVVSSSANLLTGTMRNYVSATTNGNTTGTAFTELADTLYFNYTGLVTMTIHMSGSMSAPNLLPGTSGTSSYSWFLGAAAASYTGSESSNGTTLVPTFGPGGVYPTTPIGWANNDTSYSYINQSATGFDFTGTTNVTAGNATAINLLFSTTCGAGMICDYRNTATVTLSMPTGGAFSSDSGVFLTGGASTPEPITWAMTAAGLIAIGIRRRVRR